MLVEIYLLQRFSLLLGQPLLTLAVTLFALLLSSAAGSLAGSRVRALGTGAGLGLAAALTGVVALGLGWVQGAVLPLALLCGSGGRILAALALILPLGLLMGMCFPAGLRLAGGLAPGQIAWMWGVNGVSSVAGSALAVAAGMKWGTSWALYCGAGAYLLAGASLGLGNAGGSLPSPPAAALQWRKAAGFLGIVALLWWAVFAHLAGAGGAGPAAGARRAPPPVVPEVWPLALRE
jgi:hypothetical protein